MRFVCCPNPLCLKISPYHLHVSVNLFQGTDAKEWKLVVQEIFRFLKADVACKTSRPLRYCVLYDPHPSEITPIGNLEGKKSLHLEDAILASYYHNEVGYLKFFRQYSCCFESAGIVNFSNISRCMFTGLFVVLG